jgi:hypothetical protein
MRFILPGFFDMKDTVNKDYATVITKVETIAAEALLFSNIQWIGLVFTRFNIVKVKLFGFNRKDETG